MVSLLIRDPVIILGCPRSGTSLLYYVLAEIPWLWSTGFESKEILERDHHPSAKNWQSGALDEGDLTDESRAAILHAFRSFSAPGTFWRKAHSVRKMAASMAGWGWIKKLGRRPGQVGGFSSRLPQTGLGAFRTAVRLRNGLVLWGQPEHIRLLEKTPENCLRVPFLKALFPDARVIYLIRDGRANVNSLIEGWRHPHLFRGYDPPGYPAISDLGRRGWAFTLIPGWQELVDQPVEVISAWQWVRCNEAVLAARGQLGDRLPLLSVRYEDLVARPAEALKHLADFIGADLQADLGRYANSLPEINVLSRPGSEKWRMENPEAIERVLPILAPMMARLGYA